MSVYSILDQNICGREWHTFMCDLINQEWEITVGAPQSQRSGQSLPRGHCMVLPFPWNQCTWYGCTARSEQLVLSLRERLSFPNRCFFFKKKSLILVSPKKVNNNVYPPVPSSEAKDCGQSHSRKHQKIAHLGSSLPDIGNLVTFLPSNICVT